MENKSFSNYMARNMGYYVLCWGWYLKPPQRKRAIKNAMLNGYALTLLKRIELDPKEKYIVLDDILNNPKRVVLGELLMGSKASILKLTQNQVKNLEDCLIVEKNKRKGAK